METIVTILVVAAAGLFVARRFWKTAGGKEGCSFGCDKKACQAKGCSGGQADLS